MSNSARLAPWSMNRQVEYSGVSCCRMCGALSWKAITTASTGAFDGAHKWRCWPRQSCHYLEPTSTHTRDEVIAATRVDHTLATQWKKSFRTSLCFCVFIRNLPSSICAPRTAVQHEKSPDNSLRTTAANRPSLRSNSFGLQFCVFFTLKAPILQDSLLGPCEIALVTCEPDEYPFCMGSCAWHWPTKERNDFIVIFVEHCQTRNSLAASDHCEEVAFRCHLTVVRATGRKRQNSLQVVESNCLMRMVIIQKGRRKRLTCQSSNFKRLTDVFKPS